MNTRPSLKAGELRIALPVMYSHDYLSFFDLGVRYGTVTPESRDNVYAWRGVVDSLSRWEGILWVTTAWMGADETTVIDLTTNIHRIHTDNLTSVHTYLELTED